MNSNIQSISLDTEIEIKVVEMVIQDLVVKNIIVFKEDKFLLNKNMNKEQIDEINNTQDLNNEKICIAKSLITKDESFSLKKFSLSPKDHILFEGMLKNITQFLDCNQVKGSQTKSEKLFIFGFGNYTQIVKDTIY
jgi:hypothetical protein